MLLLVKFVLVPLFALHRLPHRKLALLLYHLRLLLVQLLLSQFVLVLDVGCVVQELLRRREQGAVLRNVTRLELSLLCWLILV